MRTCGVCKRISTPVLEKKKTGKKKKKSILLVAGAVLDGAENFYREIPCPPAKHKWPIQAIYLEFACRPTRNFPGFPVGPSKPVQELNLF